MAKISFAAAAQAAPPTPVEEPANKLAARSDQSVTLYDDDSEYGAGDMERHVFQIVAKTGKLSNDFSPGDMLLNKEVIVGNTKSAVEFAIIGMRKGYQNDLEFGDDIGDTVYKATDVIDRGGTHGYRPYEDKDSTHFWKPILQLIIFLKQPAGAAESIAALFPFVVGNDSFTVAAYGVYTKTGYNGVAKKLIGLHQSQKLRGIADGEKRVLWKLTTKGETTPDGTKSWVQPTATVVGPLSTEVAEFLTTFNI